MEQPQAGEFGKAEEGDSERGGGGKGEIQDTSFYSLDFQTLTGAQIIIELTLEEFIRCLEHICPIKEGKYFGDFLSKRCKMSRTVTLRPREEVLTLTL